MMTRCHGSLSDQTVVLLPGTGSDDDFIERAFSTAVTSAGATLKAVRPQPYDLIGGYLSALDQAASKGPVVVGGVSIGAAVSARWALEHPDATVAVLAVMPAWSGPPQGAPASISAQATADSLHAEGLAAVTARMQAGSPPWLADELSRSWALQWPGLPAAMETVAGFVSPNETQLRNLPMPLVVVAASDDPIHPVEVGRDWARWAPHATLSTVTLDEIGADPSCLGHACIGALLKLRPI